MAERKLPVGIQSFQKIREDNFHYVDKTRLIWNLAENGTVYFLSRPRRFGKSLLISAMEAYFQGKKELFQGLEIEKLENRKQEPWKVYPVIRFSLSGGNYHSKDGLFQRLRNILRKYEQEYKIETDDSDLPNRFINLIEQLFVKTGKQVVVLVDEYDKPLLETIDINKEQEEENRRLYKGFFSVLKDEDQYLKFVFFTGVTKFSKVSIFSDLNQLEDISLTDDYAKICGITREEMLENFQTEIGKLAEKEEITAAECIRKLEKMYDGYHFSEGGPGVYNPFSLLNALKQRKFGRYWFSTGTPTFLIRKLQNSAFTPEQLTDGVEATEMELTDYRTDNPNPIPLFYQSGYLTISGFDREFRLYSLRFPNEEVRYGFLNSLVPDMLGSGENENPASLRYMVLDLRNGKLDSFMNRLEALFAGIPYPEGRAPVYEREWRNQVFLIFSLLGQNVKCEVHSAQGRADCVVETKGDIYLFEFKLDKSVEEALCQIDEKGYAAPYKADSRRIHKIGVNFSSEKRNIEGWMESYEV